MCKIDNKFEKFITNLYENEEINILEYPAEQYDAKEPRIELAMIGPKRLLIALTNAIMTGKIEENY